MQPDLIKIQLEIFGQSVIVNTNDIHAAQIVTGCFSAFVTPSSNCTASCVDVNVTRVGDERWMVSHQSACQNCESAAHMIYVIEKAVTIALQKCRPELFFLHAAAVSFGNCAIIILGESGAGKSTFCWQLCNSGFGYLSDELAPIDLESMMVEPYPHAICLKRELDGMSPLPSDVIRLTPTLHVPVDAIPGEVISNVMPIRAMFFLQKAVSSSMSRAQQISRSEAAARLYANGLNQLAHEKDGLKAAAEITRAPACFELSRGPLNQMHDALRHALD